MLKKPLYRKMNRTAHGSHRPGGDYKDGRHAKQPAEPVLHGSMGGAKRHGFDYTPLYKFLLSKVGEDWDAVYHEAVERLDQEEPIFRLVALNEEDRKQLVRVGESSYYSGLYVDDDNRLQKVDPSLNVAEMEPSCACCTHTFNGDQFQKKYRLPEG